MVNRKTTKRKTRRIRINKFSGLRETRKQRELRRNQGKFTKLEKKWLASEAEEWEIAHGCSCKSNCSCVSDYCLSKA